MKTSHVLVFLYGATTLIFLQFFQRYLLTTDFNPSHLGYIIAAAFTIDLLVAVPTGILADSLGVKKVTVAGLALLSVASVISVFYSTWWLLVIGFLLYRITDATVSGVINVWAKNIQGSAQNSGSGLIFTRLDQMQRIGMVVMSLIIGASIQWLGFDSPLPWVLSMICAIALIIVALRTPCTTVVSSKRESFITILSSLKNQISGSNALKISLFSVFVLGISEGMMNSKWWAWTVNELGFTSPVIFAVIIAGQSFFRVSGQEFFIRTIKDERTRFLCSLFGIAGITFLCALTLPPIISMMIWMLRIFVYSSYFPLLNKELESLSSKNTVSTVLSAVPVLNALGAILGGLICSTFELGASSTFVAMGIICAVSALLWKTAFVTTAIPAKAESNCTA
jgi:MFS family permease